jgi:basic membrane lipoprotein Med (substrate-binding protein (PBP1-ABC) superfamily)
MAPRAALAAAAIGLGALAGLAACSLVTDPSLKQLIGGACAADADCQGEGARCDVDRKCSVPCDGGACPEGSSCSFDGRCRLPLKTVIVYTLDPSVPGFARAHLDGQRFAEGALSGVEFPDRVAPGSPFVAVSGAAPLTAAVETARQQGVDVLVLTSSILRAEFKELAQNNPAMRFVQFDAPASVGPNLGSFYGNIHQAYYFAGRAVGGFYARDARLQALPTKCIGVLAPLPNPQQIMAQINAFALGVERELGAGGAELRVRWYDSFAPAVDKVDVDVDELLGQGCNVIVNRLGDNHANLRVAQRAAAAGAGAFSPYFSIAIDNETACADGDDALKATCLGGPYWNFGPAYVRLLRSLVDGSWQPLTPAVENLRAVPADSMFGFKAGDHPNLAALAFASEIGFIGSTRAEVVAGDGASDLTFANVGPDKMAWWTDFGAAGVASGPLPADAAASAAKHDVYTMCWMHQSIVEQRKGATNPSMDPPSTYCWNKLVVVPK